MNVTIGLIHEITMTVEESDTAHFTGGESLPPVLSTPRMISFMERAAHYGILPLLEEGQTSVGAWVNVRHLAGTPVGLKVRFRAEVIEIDRRRVRFKVEAWDDWEKVGEGEHDRFVIDLPRYLEKLAKKTATPPTSGAAQS